MLTLTGASASYFDEQYRNLLLYLHQKLDENNSNRQVQTAVQQAFLCCHVFPVVSELDHLLLEHVVYSEDLDFCLWKCYSRGALRFLVVLISIGTRAVLITRFPLALIFACAGFPTFTYLGMFFS